MRFLNYMQNSNVSQFPLYRSRDIETPSQIFNYFSTNTGTTTQCTPFVRAFASTEVTGSVLFMELNCQSWACKTCGPKLRWKWYEKQLQPILDASYLEAFTIQASEWDVTRKRIQRAGGQYMTYDRSDSTVLVVTTATTGGTEINRKDRKTFLTDTIANTPLKRQPISQSRSWKSNTQKIVAKKVKPKWKALDSCNKTLVEVTKILEDEGYKPTAIDHSVVYGGSKLVLGNSAITVNLNTKDYFRILWKIGLLRKMVDVVG